MQLGKGRRRIAGFPPEVSLCIADALSPRLLLQISLYIIHWPGFFTETWIDGLADVERKGLCDAVGVSNFSAKRIRETSAQLRRRGTTLSSNQARRTALCAHALLGICVPTPLLLLLSLFHL